MPTSYLDSHFQRHSFTVEKTVLAPLFLLFQSKAIRKHSQTSGAKRICSQQSRLKHLTEPAEAASLLLLLLPNRPRETPSPSSISWLPIFLRTYARSIHPSFTNMSDAYERERQNNARLSELSSKVTALRGITVDIYDNARSQDVIDDTVCAAPRF